MSPESFAIYIHVPLCARRCAYCDFYSRVADEALLRRTARALLRSVEDAPRLRGLTLYLGGGTPNLLPAPALMDLIARSAERFSLPTGAEISLEANPAANHAPGYLAALVRAGLSRLSIGFQSFDDDELRLLGRLHRSEDTGVIADARRAGVGSLSLDLLYGLPGQRPATFTRSVRRALELGVDHLSLYALKLEEGTRLWRSVNAGLAPAPDPDAAADCYLAAGELLTEAGFQQYEISNFARPGHRCRHNEHYWNAAPFLGLGPSAVGDDGLRRRRLLPDLEAWLEAVESGREPPGEDELPTQREREIEYAMLNLRKLDGLPVESFTARFGREPLTAFPDLLPHLATGSLILDDERLRLSPDRLLLADAVLRDLVDDD